LHKKIIREFTISDLEYLDPLPQLMIKIFLEIELSGEKTPASKKNEQA
jgi:hypothetical protein